MKAKQYNNIVNEYSDHIYHFLCRMLANNELASDFTQEVFLQLWNNRKKINEEKVKSWLFTTARNKALNHFKKLKESPLTDCIEWGQDSEELDFENRDLIEQGLKSLTPEERSLILLRDLEGYDYKEIAKITEIPNQHIKARLFRARRKLKKVIENLLTPQYHG